MSPRLVLIVFVAAAVFAFTLVRTSSQVLLSALPLRVETPADNPATAEKVELGRLLFWDPILSGDRDVACATCHHPDFGYAERLDTSIGVTGIGLGAGRHFSTQSAVPFVRRNSQSLLNVAFNGVDQASHLQPATAPMFWDLRVGGLEAQALEPIKAFEEMRGSALQEAQAVDEIVRRLTDIPQYRSLFAVAFGQRESVTATNLARALATFERTLVASNSPFDRYMRGDTNAMTAVQVNGMAEFQRSGCANCHNGPMFSDYKPHVLGVPDNPKLTTSDAGIGGTYAFRTPSLRNLRETAPYMHNGMFNTLAAVVQFYNGGGGRGGGGARGGGRGRGNTRNPNVLREQLDPLFRQVNVRGGRRDLLAFLDALNDASFDRTIPASVPSGLRVGGRIDE